jgi:hypothetical protein
MFDDMLFLSNLTHFRGAMAWAVEWIPGGSRLFVEVYNDRVGVFDHALN